MAAALNPRLPVWRVIGEALQPAGVLSLRFGSGRAELKGAVRIDAAGNDPSKPVDSR